MDSQQPCSNHNIFTLENGDPLEVNYNWTDDVDLYTCTLLEQGYANQWANNVETSYPRVDHSVPFAYSHNFETTTQDDVDPGSTQNNHISSHQPLGNFLDIRGTGSTMYPCVSVETSHDMDNFVEDTMSPNLMSVDNSRLVSGSAATLVENQASKYPFDVLEPAPAELSFRDPPSQEASGETSGSRSATTAAIGTVLINGKFKCDQNECASKTFNRRAELQRHYLTKHAIHKPQFWCHVASCERSAVLGANPFSRKDKLMDHIRKVHENVGEQEEVDAQVI